MTLLSCSNELSGNIGGLNSEKKQLALNNAISTSGCAIVCLQDTKMAEVNFASI